MENVPQIIYGISLRKYGGGQADFLWLRVLLAL